MASECGLLYHTSRRLTRYRIHESSSITFSRVGEIKVLFNLRRAIEDHEYIIMTVIQKDNNFKYLIRMFQLQARYGIASSRYEKLFKDVQLKPEEVYELCKLSEGCITSRCNYRYVLSYLMRKMRKTLFQIRSIDRDTNISALDMLLLSHDRISRFYQEDSYVSVDTSRDPL